MEEKKEDKRMDLQEVRKIVYRLEDIMLLGKTLPLVAWPQMMKQYEIVAKANEEDEAFEFVKDSIEYFVEDYGVDFKDKDERSLKRAFARYCKEYPDLLQTYRKKLERINYIKEYCS